MMADATLTLNDAFSIRAQKHLTLAIKHLRQTQAAVENLPGGPRREMEHALDEAYAAWRKLVEQDGAA